MATTSLARKQVRQEILTLVVILSIASVLRAGWPRLSEFKFSEARLEALALELTRHGRIPLVGVPSSAGFDHSPISVYLYVPAFLFTANPILATVYGGLINIAAVALCWHLARRWLGGGRWAATVSALLFAVSPWAVAFSRKIWQVAFVPLLALAFVGLVISGLVEGRKWRLTWAVILFAILVQVHPSAVSLAPAVLLWLLLFRHRVQLVSLAVGVTLAALTTLPFLMHQVRDGWPVWAALRSQPQANWSLASVHLAWESITGRTIHALAGDAYAILKLVPSLGWAFNSLGWLTVFATLYLGWQTVREWRAPDVALRGRAQVDAILISWLAIPVLFTLRSSLELHLHFFAVLMPCSWLIIGRAAQRVLERYGPSPLWRQQGGLAALGMLAVAQIVALASMGRFVAHHDTPGGFGRPLGQYMDVVDGALEIAGQGSTDQILVVGKGDSPVVDETPAIFDILLRGGAATRFVDGASTALFPAAPVRAVALLVPLPENIAPWYAAWPSHELGAGFRLAVLDGTWPQESLEPVVGPRTLQNGIELQGYAVDSSLQPGNEVQVWLLWQVLWQDQQDTHFSVQLWDDQRQKVSQADSVGYPAAHRNKGDRVLSRFDLIIPEEAAGELELRAGMYHYPDVANVPVIDGAGNAIGPSVLLERGPQPGGG